MREVERKRKGEQAKDSILYAVQDEKNVGADMTSRTRSVPF